MMLAGTVAEARGTSEVNTITGMGPLGTDP